MRSSGELMFARIRCGSPNVRNSAMSTSFIFNRSPSAPAWGVAGRRWRTGSRPLPSFDNTRPAAPAPRRFAPTRRRRRERRPARAAASGDLPSGTANHSRRSARGRRRSRRAPLRSPRPRRSREMRQAHPPRSIRKSVLL